MLLIVTQLLKFSDDNGYRSDGKNAHQPQMGEVEMSEWQNESDQKQDGNLNSSRNDS